MKGIFKLVTIGFDVAVIGAGPAGISCAASLAGMGLEVAVLDEQPDPGGQIYKNIENISSACLNILGDDYSKGLSLIKKFRQAKPTYFPGASVWQVNSDGHIFYSKDGKSQELAAKFIVVATGAMERPVPFPGWSLPGVMSAGGANNLIKNGGLKPKGSVVLAGGGPLLMLEAVHLIEMGVDIKAVLETTSAIPSASSLIHLPQALGRMDLLIKGISMLRKIKKAGIRHYNGIRKLSVTGSDRVESVHALKGNNSIKVDAQMLLVHFGVIPNTSIYRQVGCEHEWNDIQRYWYPRSDKWGRTSLSNIFAAGDGRFVHGAVSAALKGELTALAIAVDMKMICKSERDKRAELIENQLKNELKPRSFIDALFAPMPDLYDVPNDTLICRCECITMGEIIDAIDEGCVDPNEIKALLRPGMGPCQGKMCGSVISEIISMRTGKDIKEVGSLNIRPPLKNIPLSEIAEMTFLA
jgi:NADPH-dependent 2,4-dienoyl-CoA reductase/sulfur reductase-like enzyme